MKLLRYGEKGAEKPGMLDAGGTIRDLSGVIDDIGGKVLSPAGLAMLAALDPESLPAVGGNPRLGPCVARPNKFLAIGLNYIDHARESNLPVPEEPIIFTKATSCICGPDDSIIQPKTSTKLDWEVELGICIGTGGTNIEEADALNHVAGWFLSNDVSERYFQAERSGQWVKGKSADTFGPIGPWLVTKDEIADVQALDMFLDVNGKRMQTGNTKTMIFTAARCIAAVSEFMTLEQGDIIITGTPPGVGMGMKPQVWLKPGDTVHLGITGLGEQRQKVVAWPG